MPKNENFNKLQNLYFKVKLLIAIHFSVPNRVRNKNKAYVVLLLSNSKRAQNLWKIGIFWAGKISTLFITTFKW